MFACSLLAGRMPSPIPNRSAEFGLDRPHSTGARLAPLTRRGEDLTPEHRRPGPQSGPKVHKPGPRSSRGLDWTKQVAWHQPSPLHSQATTGASCSRARRLPSTWGCRWQRSVAGPMPGTSAASAPRADRGGSRGTSSMSSSHRCSTTRPRLTPGPSAPAPAWPERRLLRPSADGSARPAISAQLASRPNFSRRRR